MHVQEWDYIHHEKGGKNYWQVWLNTYNSTDPYFSLQDTKKTEVLIEKAKKSQEGILEKLSDKQNHLKRLEELSREVDKQLQEGRLMKQQVSLYLVM